MISGDTSAAPPTSGDNPNTNNQLRTLFTALLFIFQPDTLSNYSAFSIDAMQNSLRYEKLTQIT